VIQKLSDTKLYLLKPQCYLFNFAIATLEREQSSSFLREHALEYSMSLPEATALDFLHYSNIVICCTNDIFLSKYNDWVACHRKTVLYLSLLLMDFLILISHCNKFATRRHNRVLIDYSNVLKRIEIPVAIILIHKFSTFLFNYVIEYPVVFLKYEEQPSAS